MIDVLSVPLTYLFVFLRAALSVVAYIAVGSWVELGGAKLGGATVCP